MSSFTATPGFNCGAGFAMNSLPALQNVSLASGGFPNVTNWTLQPRTCKDVLRQAIRVNRIRKGQVMPVIDKANTVPQKRRKPLEGDIPEETLLKRQKNKEAAKRCRLKKKKEKKTLQEKIDKYKDRNKTLEDEIENSTAELSKLRELLHGHKCTMSEPRQHHVVDSSASSHVNETQHEVPTSTASEDIADSFDNLLSELQDNDRWREELMQHM